MATEGILGKSGVRCPAKGGGAPRASDAGVVDLAVVLRSFLLREDGEGGDGELGAAGAESEERDVFVSQLCAEPLADDRLVTREDLSPGRAVADVEGGDGRIVARLHLHDDDLLPAQADGDHEQLVGRARPGVLVTRDERSRDALALDGSPGERTQKALRKQKQQQKMHRGVPPIFFYSTKMNTTSWRMKKEKWFLLTSKGCFDSQI